MHLRLFNLFCPAHNRDYQSVLFAAGCGGILCGCAAAGCFKPDALFTAVMGSFGSCGNLLSCLFSSLFPLALGGFLVGMWDGFFSRAFPVALASFLLTFALCAMVGSFGISGVVPAVLLLLDRICGMFFLVWFLTPDRRQESFLPDFLFAVLGTILGSVLFTRLLSPLLTDLYQSVYISM